MIGILIITAPWTVPLLQKTQRILTAEDEIEFERSKRNSDTQIDYQRALREQVLVEVEPKTWWQRRWFEIKMAIRMFQLGFIFSPAILLSIWAYILPPFRPYWWHLLHYSVDMAGGCWIKLGQWATTRPDIFPIGMLEYFDKLQDHCTPHPFDQTETLIREQFHAEIDDLFDAFNPTPLATGAIAQVYRARLKLTGEEVAVKVLHPNISSNIQVDLAILAKVALFVNLLPGSEWMGINEAVEQFSTTMLAQLDMTFEARNLMRFSQNFSGDPHIVFPTVIDRMSTKGVLVETFEQGQPLSSYLKGAHDIAERKRLAHIGLRAYLTMLLVHNFIHADMHPGNLMVRKHPKTGEMQLVLLDVGLICELTDVDWLNFKRLFKCIVQGNGRDGANLMVEHARQTKITPENRIHFTEAMHELFTHLRVKKLSEIDIGIFMTQMLDLVRIYKVRIDTNFTTLCVGTVLLEGIGRQLHADINILDESIPFLIWSEKATLQDRMIFIREKMKDEFERDDSKDVPLHIKFYNLFGKPLLASLEAIRL